MYRYKKRAYATVAGLTREAFSAWPVLQAVQQPDSQDNEAVTEEDNVGKPVEEAQDSQEQALDPKEQAVESEEEAVNI